MPVTIMDVARKAGVSKSTVSRYLNGRYECMSQATREKIAEAIAVLDYHPNALARSLKQKRTHTIGAIVANILNPFSTSAIRGVEDYCKKSGFNLILCNADDNPKKEKEYIEMLMAKQIDGLVISTTQRNNALIENVNQKIPVVLISRKVPEINSDTVVIDNAKGVRMAIEHLLALGHRHIALFTLPYALVNPRVERVQAYQCVLGEHGIPFRAEWLVEAEANERSLLPKLTALLYSKHAKPTAIFGANDLMTMAIVKCLMKMEVRIPEDIAVIGFDDWEWASLIKPPITVIAQPAYEMGEKAAALLIRRIKGKKLPPKPALVVYEPQLIVRKSCGEL